MPSRFLSVALWPVAAVYDVVVRLRAALYRRGIFRTRQLGGAVISVGNLTTGGTGKTPMVLWLAERLAAEGYRPAILTRGYRGKVARDGNALVMADEVSLLQRRLGDRALFGVGKNRYATAGGLRRREPDGLFWMTASSIWRWRGTSTSCCWMPPIHLAADNCCPRGACASRAGLWRAPTS